MKFRDFLDKYMPGNDTKTKFSHTNKADYDTSVFTVTTFAELMDRMEEIVVDYHRATPIKMHQYKDEFEYADVNDVVYAHGKQIDNNSWKISLLKR